MSETTSHQPVWPLREHPGWCNVSYACEVRADGVRDGEIEYSGHHVGKVGIVEVSDWRIEIAEVAFHDTDGSVDKPELRLRVIDTGYIDKHLDAYLSVEQGQKLIAAVKDRITYIEID